MVFKTSEQILVECECGIETMKVTKYKEQETELEEYYIEFLQSHFYSKQEKRLGYKLKYKLKYIWYILTGKEYLLEQIVLSKYNVEQLIQALQELKDLNEY